MPPAAMSMRWCQPGRGVETPGAAARLPKLPSLCDWWGASGILLWGSQVPLRIRRSKLFSWQH